MIGKYAKYKQSQNHFCTTELTSVNFGLAMASFLTTESNGQFLEGPKKFSNPESRRKIPKLMFTELFCLHILNMTRSSLQT